MAQEDLILGAAPNDSLGEGLRDGMIKVQSNFDEIYNGVQLNTLSTPPAYAPGLMWFDGVNFNAYDNIPGTSLQRNKELVVDVYNDNGADFTNFTPVRYANALNGTPTMVRAQADTIANCSGVAICTHNVAIGELGKVTTHGTIGGDTSMWSVNDALYVSSTVAGALTNIEQPISAYIGRVLVADTEANGGKIIVSQRGILNVTALGQSSGLNKTQTITATPAGVTAYDNNAFELNTIVTHTGTTNLTTSIAPSREAASGYYRVSFNVSITAVANDLYTFEVYKNGLATGVLALIDLRNNNIDAGSCAISGLSQTAPLTPSDNIEVYAYSSGGGGGVTYESALLNIERLGNV